MRLADLLQKWTKGCKTVEEVRDVVVKEQLLNSLPTDIRIWVTEKKPKTSVEAAELADNYLRARRRNAAEGFVGQAPADHAKKTWLRDRREGRSEPPNTAQTTREKGPNQAVKREPREWREGVQCYNCGKKGHVSRQCPNNALFCVGWKEGLRRAGTVNGHRVDDIMLDTGCSKTMVHRHLVSKGELVEGKSSVVRTLRSWGFDGIPHG